MAMGDDRSRGWRRWWHRRLEDWVSGCLVVFVAARLTWLWVCLGFGMSFCVGFFFFFDKLCWSFGSSRW